MTQIVIATQHDEEVNALLRQRLPEYNFLQIPGGAPHSIPPEATILLARPVFRAGNGEKPRRPAGWPFNLQWVHLSSSGIDTYPDWLFEVPLVTSARGTSAVAVAEFALAAVLASAKRFPEVWITEAAQWQRHSLQLVSGSVLGIVGFGAIGSALAIRAQALGVRVIAANHSGKPFYVPGVERAKSLPALFAEADHVVIAAPATADTHHLVNAELLSHAKPGLHLINIARGSLVDEQAWIAALDAGQLSRATLDVSQIEPAPANHPFYSHPKVRLSPHVSPATRDLWGNVIEQFVSNLLSYHKGEPLAEQVDFKRGY
jgi:phosphoglycerate dehydrogenase-like enzyme